MANRLMIYPEKRVVSDEQIVAWYRDELCNDALKDAQRQAGRPLTDLEASTVIENAIAAENANDIEIDVAMEYLGDSGVVTFGNRGEAV